MTSSPASAAFTIAPGERRLALIGVFLCIFLSALDQTIVATALPRIVDQLGHTNLYAWVATSFLLASTVSLPVAGRMADIVSPKYVLIVAAVVFLVGSALSGLSHSMYQLILFRGIQGLGGGAIIAVALTTIGLMFPPRQRGRIQGLFGAVFGIASVVGPYLGGLLTDSFSWRYVFYVNMPFGILALYVLLVHMPRLTSPRHQRFDVPGFATLVVWCVALVLALSWGGSTYAWSSLEVLGLFGVATLGLGAFYFIERRSAAPLFDMSLLHIPTFTWTGLASLCFGAAFLGSVLFIPFYLVMAKNISPLASGLTLTPLVGGTVVGSVSGGFLAQRLGRVKWLLLVGSAWATALFVVLHAILTPVLPVSTLLFYLALLGVGIGPGFSLYVLAVQNVVPPRQMGVASSGNMFFRQMGSAIGAAVMGVVLASTLSTQIPAHLPKSVAVASSQFSASSDSLADQTQTRTAILAKFHTVAREATSALEGSRSAYRTLAHTPGVTAKDLAELPPGGIPAKVHAEVARELTLVRAAVAGRAGAQATVAHSTLPTPIKALAAHPPTSATARTAAMAQVEHGLTTAEPGIIRRAEAAAIPVARRGILAAGHRTANEVVRAITVSITAAVKNVLGVAALLAAAALLLGFLIPNLELRHVAGADGMETAPDVALGP